MRITIVGGGIMGSGIAYAAAVAGFDTVLNDLSTEYLDQGLRSITSLLDGGIERGKLRPEDKSATLSRLVLEQDLMAAVDGAELVIEAVPKDMTLKHKIFVASTRTLLRAPCSRRIPLRSALPRSPPPPAILHGSSACTSSTQSPR